MYKAAICGWMLDMWCEYSEEICTGPGQLMLAFFTSNNRSGARSS